MYSTCCMIKVTQSHLWKVVLLSIKSFLELFKNVINISKSLLGKNNFLYLQNITSRKWICKSIKIFFREQFRNCCQLSIVNLGYRHFTKWYFYYPFQRLISETTQLKCKSLNSGIIVNSNVFFKRKNTLIWKWSTWEKNGNEKIKFSSR